MAPPTWGLQETGQTFADLLLRPGGLAEMISLIESGAISGKIGKQILPALLKVRRPPTNTKCNPVYCTLLMNGLLIGCYEQDPRSGFPPKTLPVVPCICRRIIEGLHVVFRLAA
jgi:hypothetical protein